MHAASTITFRAAALAVLLAATGCGMRLGVRHSYRDPSANGVYGGPWAAFAWSTADRAEAVGSSPYLYLETAYDFAHGPDAATLGGGLGFAPDAYGWHDSVLVLASWEALRGFHLSLCEGYGNWGVVQACGRWSSRGWWGVDLGAGLSATRFAADVHEHCREGCSGGSGWDD